MNYDFDEAEELRLIDAFNGISDAETRRIIIAIVEAAAQGAQVKLNDPEQKSDFPKFDA